MFSFYINLEKLILKSSIEQLISQDIIRPFPLAYMRGASLDDCIIIIDETQNITVDNIRTIMTRIGSNSKLIILGDVNQIDLKNKNESSLRVILDIFQNVENIGIVKMSEDDVNVRNPIIKIIEDKFKNYFSD